VNSMAARLRPFTSRIDPPRLAIAEETAVRITLMPEETLWKGTSSQVKNFWLFVACILVIPIPWAIAAWLRTKCPHLHAHQRAAAYRERRLQQNA